MSAGIAEALLQENFDAVDIVTEVINRVESALEVARTSTGKKVHAITATLEPNPA
jgi:regulator of PEP synthase PpsR (kinase-PPPase family)